MEKPYCRCKVDTHIFTTFMVSKMCYLQGRCHYPVGTEFSLMLNQRWINMESTVTTIYQCRFNVLCPLGRLWMVTESLYYRERDHSTGYGISWTVQENILLFTPMYARCQELLVQCSELWIFPELSHCRWISRHTDSQHTWIDIYVRRWNTILHQHGIKALHALHVHLALTFALVLGLIILCLEYILE